MTPCRYIYRLTVQVGPVGNRVAKVDPYAKANGSIRGLVAVVDRDLLLDLHGAPNGTVYTVEYDQQRIATSLHDFAAMLLDRRIN